MLQGPLENTTVVVLEVCLNNHECVQRCQDGELVCTGCAPGYILGESGLRCEGKCGFYFCRIHLFAHLYV